MTNKIECNWKEKMAFEAIVNNHKIMIDADESVGGEDKGPRPKPLMLVSLAGCTGMDVVSILKKMRVDFDDFSVSVEGELTEEHPKYYKLIKVVYKFKGKNLPKEKLEKAVDLSKERYCGVSVLLEKATELTYEIIIEE